MLEWEGEAAGEEGREPGAATTRQASAVPRNRVVVAPPTQTAPSASTLFYMSIEITMTSREVVEEFEATIAGYEEVTAVCRLYGPVDYLARVEVADGNAYERFQAEKMYTLPAVRRITSAPTMKVVKSSA
ncbi:Lrp/AsnC ligand binding domain-containing protein [Nocardia abscessus]|uniref:Lrp/AsnC ligand binding domain-containing protein n=1 Tax=Nocardia abscessus TaxID=120957 RepID=UPI0024588BAB|nr:Lrp/AsnC ligand binding domain-containing protein [Nocardia abscessus]